MKKMSIEEIDMLYDELEYREFKLKNEEQISEEYMHTIAGYIGMSGIFFNPINFIFSFISKNYRKKRVEQLAKYIDYLTKSKIDVHIAREKVLDTRDKIKKLGLPIDGQVLTGREFTNYIHSVIKQIK